MFEDTVKSIQDTIKNLKTTQDYTEQASRDYDELNREITNAKTRLRRKLSPQRGEAIARSLVKSMLESGELEIILIQAIDNATQTSTEFSQDFYKTALYTVAQQKQIYKLPLFGSGWSSKIIPLIAFEEEAGNLSDYARGVKAYRASLKTKIGKEGSNRGAKATEFWLSNVYSTPREESTVQGRIGISGKIAPFWQLLNSGTTKLSSDRPDASYAPIKQTPTDFIGRAEEQIRKLFDTSFNNRYRQELQEAEALQAEIDTALQVRDDLKNTIKMLSPDSKQNQRALNILGSKFEYVDRGKLAQALQRFASGDEAQRILISRSGGRRVYLTARQAEGILEY